METKKKISIIAILFICIGTVMLAINMVLDLPLDLVMVISTILTFSIFIFQYGINQLFSKTKQSTMLTTGRIFLVLGILRFLHLRTTEWHLKPLAVLYIFIGCINFWAYYRSKNELPKHN
jgi:hypothetical protein